METSRPRYRWVMLALVWLPYFTFGVFTRSLAPLVTPILKDLNMSFVQMGFILGSWQLVYIGSATFCGALLDKWGLRKALFAAVIVLGLSEGLRYFASGFFTLLFCVSLIGLGGPVVAIGCAKAISIWFDGKERGLAAGIYTTAPSVGAFLSFSTANAVVMPLTGYNWRLTFAVYSSIAIVVAAVWWLWAKDKEQEGKHTEGGLLKVFGELVKLRFVQILLVMGLISFMMSHGFNSWLPQILESKGITPKDAGFMASIPVIISVPFVLFIPRLTTPGTRSHFIAFLSLATAVSLVMVGTGTGAKLISGLVIYGIASLSLMPIIMLILMESPQIGSKYIGSAAGLYFAVAEIGGFSGPFILGAVRNATGSFLSGTFFVAGLAILMAIIGFVLKAQTREKPQPGL